jgi:hypothetical protein
MQAEVETTPRTPNSKPKQTTPRTQSNLTWKGHTNEHKTFITTRLDIEQQKMADETRAAGITQAPYPRKRANDGE